jgi:hypothetical protein
MQRGIDFVTGRYPVRIKALCAYQDGTSRASWSFTDVSNRDGSLGGESVEL